MFFEHSEFGLIRTVDATDISVARFKKIQPVITVLDKFGALADARYRFTCISIEREGFF